jgi:hypothetical protein
MRYEKNGQVPRCQDHGHVSEAVAVDLVRDDEARFVGGAHTKVGFCRAIVKTDSMREWRNRPSGRAGFTVRQLVKIRGRKAAFPNTVEAEQMARDVERYSKE